MTSCATFALSDSTGHIYLSMPIIQGVNMSTNMSTENFTFVSNDYEVIDKEIDSEPLIIQGTEVIDSTSWCIPIPICADDFGYICADASDLYLKFKFILDIMNAGREVYIYGINDEVDAIYIIKRFGYRFIENSQDGFEWTLELEYKKDAPVAWTGGLYPIP